MTIRVGDVVQFEDNGKRTTAQIIHKRDDGTCDVIVLPRPGTDRIVGATYHGLEVSQIVAVETHNRNR